MVRNLIIDCHADTLLKPSLGKTFKNIFGIEEDLQVSKDLLLQGRVNVQVFALFVPPRLEKLGIEFTLEMIANAKDMENEGFTLIRSRNDLQRLVKQKQQKSIGMVLSMEGALALERNLKLLPIFAELGIRNIGLAWSRKNLFAEGSSFTQQKIEGEGLSSHGKELIEQMDKLGLVIDISHLNEKGVADVTKLTNNPFIASHSNAYKLCPVRRNLTDEQLMEIASANGVVGINFYPGFLTQKEKSKSTINDVILHIEYISELIGVEHVGLGSDFDGISMTPKGLENASKIKNIPPLLEKEGFSDQEITKIMGGNFQRVFETVWPKSSDFSFFVD